MSYTLIVGTKDWSSWSLRPYLALCATGQPFQEIVIRLRETSTTPPATRSEISPARDACRCLKIEQGGKTVTVWDSLAICETIAERHPEAGLWPDDWAARADSAILFGRNAFRLCRCARPVEHGFRPDLALARPQAATPRADRAHPVDLGGGAGAIWRTGRISVRALFHRRLHVCAGGVALHHLRR